MSYHNKSNFRRQINTTHQGTTPLPPAPRGYHYMPDGTLMSDVEHQELYGVVSPVMDDIVLTNNTISPPPQPPLTTATNVIKSLNLDLSDLPAAGEKRLFSIISDGISEFKLEIKDNSTDYYYNFTTDKFQATEACKTIGLERSIENGNYDGYITFPNTITTDTVNGDFSSGATAITMDTAVATKMAVGDRVTGNAVLDSAVYTVATIDSTNVFSLSASAAIDDGTTLSFSGDDQYDISFWVLPGTKHADYEEVRFGDGTVDINSSTGSNSLVMKKVIYQYADTLLTMSMYSIGGAITLSNTNGTINFSRGKNKGKIPFRASAASASGESFTIIKQPSTDDILSFITPTVGSAPEDLPGEDIYPTARDAFTDDDINGAITSGSVVRMDNTDLSAVIKVGDKITTTVMTDTVNGDFESGATAITMDSAVATKMAVGDRVTGNTVLDAGFFTVASLDSTNVFSVDSEIGIADGITLSFSSKINRSTTTVTVVETSSVATDFTMSQAIQFRDNAPLTFWPRKNYQWPLDSIDKIVSGMVVVPGTNVTTDTRVSDYQDTITIFEDTEDEEKIIKNQAPATDTKAQTPTITKGLVTAQPGNVVFDKQQVLALAGDALKIGGYGESSILRIYDWDVKFSDLAIALDPVTTTTTAACIGSTSVVLAARDGILNDTSTVSGIGIDASTINPTVDSGASATGAGTVVLTAAQTLESGVTLTFDGAGKTATITGNIEIIKSGTGSPTLRFDVGRLLTSA